MKGLAKGLNLCSFVIKGLVLIAPTSDMNDVTYFLMTLLSRGVLSSLLKCLCSVYILRVKKMKYKKVQVNLIYHVIPTALLFIALKLYIVWYSIDFFNREEIISFLYQRHVRHIPRKRGHLPTYDDPQSRKHRINVN